MHENTRPVRRLVTGAVSARPVPGLLSVSARLDGDEPTIYVRGEADISTADQLRDQLTSAVADHQEPVVIDLSGLTFCGVAGLFALQAAIRSASEAGSKVSIVGMSRQVSWLFLRFPSRPDTARVTGAVRPDRPVR